MSFKPNFHPPRATSSPATADTFRLETDIAIPMRDGTVLATDLYFPLADGPHPVLLERTPYGKHSSVMLNIEAPQYLAGHGYIVAIQDTRGRFASEGDWYPFRDEAWGQAQDGQDTVEWLAKQAFCTGKVGTFGGSYAGFNQYTMAGAMPPSLAATFPRQAPCSLRREWVYRGGALEMGFILLRWARRMGVEALRNRAVQYNRKAERATLNWPQAGHPLCSNPFQWIDDYIRLQDDEKYWRQWDVEPFHAEFDRPSFHVASWFDIFCGGSLANFRGMRAKAGSDAVRNAHRLVIGPWAHGPFMYREPEGRWCGEMDLGTSAFWDYKGAMLRWFDHWLKGERNGVMDGPPVTYFLMGANQWKTCADWPPPETRYRELYLDSRKSGASESINDGSLSWEPVDDAGIDRFRHDPANPVPSLGGATLFTIAREEAEEAESWEDINAQSGSRDQRPIEPRCLTYTSAPLPQDLEISGDVRASLFVSSNCVDTDFVVRLCDVYPDGRSMLLCDGILRMRYRNSDFRPENMQPGQVYRAEVDLWAASNLFRAGHRIRLVINSSCFPRFDVNPGTGQSIFFTDVRKVAENRVHSGGDSASFVLLPIQPGQHGL